MSKKTVIYYFHGRGVGITRRFISCHGVVRLVPSNRLYIISTTVMSGLPKGLLVATVS